MYVLFYKFYDYFRFIRKVRFEVVMMQKGVKPAQITLACWFNKPHITAPIIGVSQVRHIEEAVEALEIKLNSGEMKRLEDPYKPHQIMGHS